MKYLFLIMTCFVAFTSATGQVSDSLVTGTVSYRNPQNVYVKFQNTDGMKPGDTLWITHPRPLSYEERGADSATLEPALIVRHVSSISVVGEQITDLPINVADILIYKVRRKEAHREGEPIVETSPVKQPEPEIPVVPVPEEDQEDQIVSKPAFQEDIRGRLSASFYSNVLNAEEANVQRMRYTFSMQAKNLGDSRFSAETYVSFRHQLDDWRGENIEMSKALRVYSFAATYQGERTAFVLGRKVNTHISNIGAIDGLQGSYGFGDWTAGGFAGMRPDHQDYGLNFDLLQFGGFISHRAEAKHGVLQSSLALVEQRNGGMTDRRFVYMQHSSTLTKSISAFGSFEVDLYERPDSVAKSTFNITGAYFSLQYRPSRKITLHGSYDARKNVIYYETFKNFIDDLIEQETRQGLRFRANYKPIKRLSIGSSIGYRFQKDSGSNSMNMQYYATYSQVPWIKASMTASATLLENEYLNGLIYGVRVSRDVIKQKIFGEIEFRKVQYEYGNSGLNVDQLIGGINLSWRIRKQLSLSVDYEGIFENEKSNHRVHVNVIQRF